MNIHYNVIIRNRLIYYIGILFSLSHLQSLFILINSLTDMCLISYDLIFYNWLYFLLWIDHLTLRFSQWHNSKESTCNAGDTGDAGTSPELGGENSNPLLYSYQENPMEKSHEQRRLAGYSPWGHKESGTTERPSTFDFKLLCKPDITSFWLVIKAFPCLLFNFYSV